MKLGTAKGELSLFLELYDRGNAVLTNSEMQILLQMRRSKANFELDDTLDETSDKVAQMSIRSTSKSNRLGQSIKLKYDIVRHERTIGIKEAVEDCHRNFPDHLIIKHLPKFSDCGKPILIHEMHPIFAPKCLDPRDAKWKDLDESEISHFISAVYRANELYDKLYEEALSNRDDSKFYVFMCGSNLVSFECFRMALYKKYEILEFQNFQRMMDAYQQVNIDKIDSKLEKNARQKKSKIPKIDAIFAKNQKKIEILQKKIDILESKAECMTDNIPLLASLTTLLNNAIDNFSNSFFNVWYSNIEFMYGSLKKCIHEISLKDRSLKISLYSSALEKFLLIHFSLNVSVQSNIQSLYVERQKYINDIDKTKQSFDIVRKKFGKNVNNSNENTGSGQKQSNSQKNNNKLQQQSMRSVQSATPLRQYWFEDFHWFFTSENVLVVGGRDAQQNDQLVKRYLSKGDKYIHADVHGASSIIVKTSQAENYSHVTLCEAGKMALVYSRCWINNASCRVFWVEYDQVSYVAPSGQFRTTGGFIINGKRNFLPPVIGKMQYNVSLLFKIKSKSSPQLLEPKEQARGTDNNKIDLSTDVSANHDGPIFLSQRPAIDENHNTWKLYEKNLIKYFGSITKTDIDDHDQDKDVFVGIEAKQVREKKVINSTLDSTILSSLAYKIDFDVQEDHKNDIDYQIDAILPMLSPDTAVDCFDKKYVIVPGRLKKGEIARGLISKFKTDYQLNPQALSLLSTMKEGKFTMDIPGLANFDDSPAASKSKQHQRRPKRR
ncbi:MAG: hypothetical protein MHMPM18_002412 [Marteilia pararefringens]